MNTPNVYAKLVTVQRKLRAPKSLYNSFGKYAYRSCEDVLEALKPLLSEVGLALVIEDSVIEIEGRFYIEAKGTLYDVDSDKSISTKAIAREPNEKKGMDASQITGATSSYARKYMLNAMFAIDDNKDADTLNKHEEGQSTNQRQQNNQRQNNGYNNRNNNGYNNRNNNGYNQNNNGNQRQRNNFQNMDNPYDQ